MERRPIGPAPREVAATRQGTWCIDDAHRDAFASFERLREQGKILFWGVSNFDAPELDAARGSWCGGHPRSRSPRRPNPRTAADNAGAVALRLTEAELARTDAAFPRGRLPGRRPML